ncbi:MAG TPA: NmrA family NAD(P)-binding protein [Bellilinea sp.]|nr:NmrA family NAD(P)-binding protein [Bellilinea sp.]
MILITGAAGKTGHAILKAAVQAGEDVRVLVRRDSQTAELRELGASGTVVGDMADPTAMQQACIGIRTIYHICPNMNPDEVSIGQNAITAAKQAGVDHFVYHSVLHPQVKEMQHHWNKLLVEGLLFTSGLNFTILQPASYMQNITGYLQKMQTDGIYSVPYSIDAKFSMIDLDDLAQAAAVVIREGQKHYQATYELSGAQILSSADIANLAAEILRRPVLAVELDRTEWDHNARASGMDEYARTTLISMFEYYHHFGFTGNATILRMLLGRSPARVEDYLARLLADHPA